MEIAKKFLIFQETETPKKCFIFQENESFISRNRYIQNTSLFGTRSIFKTLVYLKPKAYSEHCQTSMMKRFAKTAT